MWKHQSKITDNLTFRMEPVPHRGHRVEIARKLAAHFRLPAVVLFWAAASLFFSGCTLLKPQPDPTRFFLLTAPNPRTASAPEGKLNQWRVGLKAVVLPAYLQTKLMAVRRQNNEVVFSEFNRWAESLDQGISSVMKENLGTLPSVGRVVVYPNHGADAVDYEVAIRVLACEGAVEASGAASIRFVAEWELTAVGTKSAVAGRGTFTAQPATWDGKNFGQLARALSEAVAGLSESVGQALPAKPRK